MNIFKKYYTCDAVEDGKVVGSMVASFYVWVKPTVAYSEMRQKCQEANVDCNPINFRRIK